MFNAISNEKTRQPTHDKEIFALMTAFQKQRYYILENRIVVYTNNRIVENILKQKDLESARRERWQETLVDYDLEFIHILRCKNFIADIFSRQNKKKEKEINALKLKSRIKIKDIEKRKELMKMTYDEPVEEYCGGKKISLRLSKNFYQPNMLQNYKD